MIVMDTADTEARREERIPVDLNLPIELSVHIPVGDVTVRATERSDVLINHAAPGSFGDLDESELMIDARNNRIEVRANSGAGIGWAGIAGDVDLEAVVGQITRAFRRGGYGSSAKPGRARVAVGRHAWSDITIDVPQTITGRVEIHSASGDVRIEGVRGEIALNTMSGDVRVVRTSGDLALQTASGDLVVEGASGRLTAQTASGDVRVASAQIEGFHIQTANGDILLDALLTGAGPFRVQTASGDVRLTLRRSAAGGEDPAVSLAYQTVSGDAHVPQPFRKTGHRLWRAGSGDSGPHIEVTTVSGDLTAGFAAASSFAPSSSTTSPVDNVPPAPPTPPAPPVAPVQPSSPTEPAPLSVDWAANEVDVTAAKARPEAAQSTVQDDGGRLAVLEAVERGEIDVEEALRRLEAADSSPSM
jgi:Putative adhesin